MIKTHMNTWKDKYDWVGVFYEGVAIVRHCGKFGIIDKRGNELCTPKYSYMSSYYNGVARVEYWLRDDLTVVGTIDLKGKEYFKPDDRAKLRQHKIRLLLSS
jgi:hypothetical protein